MILFQLVLQQAFGDAQEFGGPDLDLAGLFQGPADHLLLDGLQGLGQRRVQRHEAVDVQLGLGDGRGQLRRAGPRG